MLYIIISVDDNTMITIQITIQIIENKNKLLNNKNK